MEYIHSPPRTRPGFGLYIQDGYHGFATLTEAGLLGLRGGFMMMPSCTSDSHLWVVNVTPLSFATDGGMFSTHKRCVNKAGSHFSYII
jgi:hypothetical protein